MKADFERAGLPSPPRSPSLDTGRLLPGEETTLVLTEPGTYPFHDTEAPSHKGELRVVEDQP